MTKYNKAMVALLGAIATLVGAFGIDTSTFASQELIAAISTMLTTILVYAVPNIK